MVMMLGVVMSLGWSSDMAAKDRAHSSWSRTTEPLLHPSR